MNVAAEARKDETVHFKCTAREKAALDKIAELDGQNQSAMLRELIREKAKRLKVWYPEGVSEEE